MFRKDDGSTVIDISIDENGEVQTSVVKSDAVLPKQVQAPEQQQPSLEIASSNGYVSFLNTPFMLAVRKAFNSAKAAFNTTIFGGGDFSDFWNTFLRLLQVGSNVVANDGNNASENANGIFYRIFYTGGEGSSLKPGFGTVLAGIGIAVFVSGTIIKVYQEYRQRVLRSYDYLIRQLKKVSSTEYKVEDIVNGINDLMARKKITSRLDKPENRDKERKASAGIRSLADLADPLNGKKHAFRSHYKETPTVGEQVIGTVSLAAKKVWNFFDKTGFIYWITWFPLMIGFGMTAASTSMFLAPIILSITFAIHTLYLIGKAINRFSKANLTPEQLQQREENKLLDAEAMRMLTEGKQRYFQKQEHIAKMKMLAQIAGGTYEMNKSATNEKFIDEKEKKYLKMQRDKLYAPEKLKSLRYGVDDLRNSRLGRYLLQGRKRSATVAVGLEIAGGVISVAMVFWICSAAAFVLPGTMASSIFHFFDSGINTGIAGSIMSGLFAFKKIAEIKRDNGKFENDAGVTLLSQYKNKDKTKLEKFEELELSLEFEKAKIQYLRLLNLFKIAKAHRKTEYAEALNAKEALMSCKALLNADKPQADKFDDYTKANKIIGSLVKDLQGYLVDRKIQIQSKDMVAEYNIDKVNVYNHAYFNKQKEQKTWNTSAKQAAGDVQAAAAGGQSGIFDARVLLLVGGIGATIFVGLTAPWFLAAALGLALVVGGLRVAKRIIDRKTKNHEEFVGGIDVRISYMRKKKEELREVSSILQKSAAEKSQNADAITDNSTTYLLKKTNAKKPSHIKVASNSEEFSAPANSSSDLTPSACAQLMRNEAEMDDVATLRVKHR